MNLEENASGIPLKPVYDRIEGTAHELGEPGAFPYARGVRKDMYRGRLWTMRQYAGFGSAAESNARYRYLLEHGTTGLSVAFDLPTQLGYDSDAPQSRGEVGKVGVAIDSVADMETLLHEIPLDRVTVSMTINAPASIILAMLLAVARRRIPFNVPDQPQADPGQAQGGLAYSAGPAHRYRVYPISASKCSGRGRLRDGPRTVF